MKSTTGAQVHPEATLSSHQEKSSEQIKLRRVVRGKQDFREFPLLTILMHVPSDVLYEHLPPYQYSCHP